MQETIELISSVYVFVFVIQMILLGFDYHSMVNKSVIKTITSVHGIFLITSMIAIILDGVKNPYIVTAIVSFVGFVIGVSNDRD